MFDFLFSKKREEQEEHADQIEPTHSEPPIGQTSPESVPAPAPQVPPSTPEASEPREEAIYEQRRKLLKEKLFNWHNGATLFSPVELTRVNNHLPQKLLIVGHCNAENWGFHQQNLTKTPVEFLLVNNLQVLPARSDEELRSFDFQVVQFPLRFIFSDSTLWGIAQKNEADLKAAFEDACKKLEQLFDLYMQYNAQMGLQSFVVNFMVPSFNPRGKLLPYFTLANPQYFVEQLNQKLESLIGSRTNTFCLNINTLTNFYGKRFIQEDVLHLISHGSFMPGNLRDSNRIEHAPPLHEHYAVTAAEFRNALWVEILNVYRIANPVDPVKLVIVDLDDTLWNGLIAERDVFEPGISEGWPVGLLEALSYFKDRGGLIAIVSKNDDALVRAAWNKIYESRFPLHHFVSVKCGFRAKSEAVEEIIKEAQLTEQSTLFIDDNPVERAEVKTRCPNIRVLHGYHYYWRKVLMLAAETQIAAMSEESSKRTELVKAAFERQKSLQGSSSREAFLKDLEIRVSIHPLTEGARSSFERGLELLNKTNQFNTTGQRWTAVELSQAMAQGEVFFFTVDDRFASHGICGVVITRPGHILQFVMSCRVIGMDVEAGVLASIVDRMRASSVVQLNADLRSTAFNLPCQAFYRQAGFTQVPDQWILPADAAVVSAFVGQCGFAKEV